MLNFIPGRVSVIVLGALVLAGTWLSGRYQGTQLAVDSAMEQTRRDISQDYHDRVQSLEQKLVQLQQELQSEVAKSQSLQAEADELQNTLLETQLVADSVSAELSLFRRIAGGESAEENLALESIVWRSSQPPSLELTLIQGIGSEPATGRVVVSLGFEKTDSGLASGADQQQSRLVPVDAIDFRFRFFQRLVIPVDVALSSDPAFIEIRVVSENNPENSLVNRIEWTELSKIVD